MRDLRIYAGALSLTEISALSQSVAENAKVAATTSGAFSQSAVGHTTTASMSAAIPFLSIEKYHLVVTGSSGQIYTLLATTNLLVTWQPLAILTNINGRADFTDTEAHKFNERFYRILAP